MTRSRLWWRRGRGRWSLAREPEAKQDSTTTQRNSGNKPKHTNTSTYWQPGHLTNWNFMYLPYNPNTPASSEQGGVSIAIIAWPHVPSMHASFTNVTVQYTCQYKPSLLLIIVPVEGGRGLGSGCGLSVGWVEGRGQRCLTAARSFSNRLMRRTRAWTNSILTSEPISTCACNIIIRVISHLRPQHITPRYLSN